MRRLEVLRDALAIVALLFPITLITGHHAGLGLTLYVIGLLCLGVGGFLGVYLRYRES